MCLYTKKTTDAQNHQKLGERYGTDVPLETTEETNLAHTLISDFWPPEL
jgi:hypothetical protein